MATCGGLRSLFEAPLPPENPTLMESLSSWQNQIPKKPLDHASFTEIFGELHFQEKPLVSSSSIFSCNKKSADSLQLCTEGLGSESSDDVDDMSSVSSDVAGGDDQEIYKQFNEKMDQERLPLGSYKYKYKYNNCNNSRGGGSLSANCKSEKGAFPPPISSIGRSGKPWVCFKAYREDGRFVLREVRLPTTQEVVLRASRHDGRLKLRFACPEEDIIEGNEDETVEDELFDDEGDQEAETETETEFVSRA